MLVDDGLGYELFRVLLERMSIPFAGRVITVLKLGLIGLGSYRLMS